MPEAESAAVYAADSRYSNGTRNLGRITLASDNVFSDNTDAQIVQQTATLVGDATAGYSGTVTIPIDFTAERSTAGTPPTGGNGGPPPDAPST